MTLTDLHTRLMAHGLSLPEAWEDHPWGETALKVRKKVFVFSGLARVVHETPSPRGVRPSARQLRGPTADRAERAEARDRGGLGKQLPQQGRAPHRQEAMNDPGLGETLSLGVKLPFSGEATLALPCAKPMGYGLGRHGWVSLSRVAPPRRETEGVPGHTER